jgi:hypothetical protein
LDRAYCIRKADDPVLGRRARIDRAGADMLGLARIRARQLGIDARNYSNLISATKHV